MEELDDQKIKAFLEGASLYSWQSFTPPQFNRSSLHINEIDSFCEVCEQNRPFQDLRSRGGGAGMRIEVLSSGTSYFEFTCVSCRKQKHQYLVEQIVSETEIKMQKYGELPRKKLDRDKALQKFFSDDSENYEKAVICLSHGFGVAAFAYFRRIVENNIDKLLEMIQEDSSRTESNTDILAALEELKKQSPMSDKIAIANNALPVYLKPDGLNPLGRLYQILSEGVHSLSDSDCLARANNIQVCLKYLISELGSRKANSTRFKSMVGSL
jgi:hypothetical protein|tara:strand:- start:1146 stop:1952 length:807 start_codon:yes stop_codon:yes gene_type:complete